MKWTNRLGRWLVVGGAWSTAALMLGAVGTGCLSRPVGQQPPTTKVNFTSSLAQRAVDKVDLLFAIDNSASMGDKQAILAEAVPDLINGLLTPPCIDGDGNPVPGELADPTSDKENRFGCPAGTEPEFTPVTDLHIGIVSSSLGNFGGDVCAVDNPRSNDRGHLINRKLDGGEVELAKPGNFLAWFPKEAKAGETAPANPIRTIEGPSGLTENFRELVSGVGQDGCGLEAQLESVYRFLIQPDPWESIERDNFGKAQLNGIDVEILRQRADFLRPDSLVAVIMLTDEDDSSADPLSVRGGGWNFMAWNFSSSNVLRGGAKDGTTAPRGTKICETDPGAKDEQGNDLCTSCGFARCDPNDPKIGAWCKRLQQDPNCTTSGVPGKSGSGYDGYYGPKDEDLNVRFHRMKERYGIDPQYPLSRYVDGFTKTQVPDRNAEHVTTELADGDRDIAEYTGAPTCTNPLFAKELPREAGDELCALKRGTRSPGLVFFAVVGGVPHQLLHFTANDPEKSRITSDDWTKILGRNPDNYDFTGISPYMIQSVAPRTAAGLDGADAPRGDNGDGTHPHGREWNTNKVDLQYACTFDLPTDMQRDCAISDQSCDCADTSINAPLCDTGTRQVKAKAYPTVRPLRIVRALGEQGIVSSLCPIQLDDRAAPDYGYRPAVATIIDRLKNVIKSQCLPQQLRERGAEVLPVPCLVLAQLGEPTDSCEARGLASPSKAILDVFREQQREASGDVSQGGVDLAALPVCEIPQKTVPRGETCKSDSEMTWCYVENDPANKKNPAGQCPQALVLSGRTDELAGAVFSLQCIQQLAAGAAAGDAPPAQP